MVGICAYGTHLRVVLRILPHGTHLRVVRILARGTHSSAWYAFSRVIRIGAWCAFSPMVRILARGAFSHVVRIGAWCAFSPMVRILARGAFSRVVRILARGTPCSRILRIAPPQRSAIITIGTKANPRTDRYLSGNLFQRTEPIPNLKIKKSVGS